MTEFQEGRTYLWVYRDFEARIVTGELDGDLLDGDDGCVYEFAAGPLTPIEYREAGFLIRNREWFLEARVHATAEAKSRADKLVDLWRSVKDA